MCIVRPALVSVFLAVLAAPLHAQQPTRPDLESPLGSSVSLFSEGSTRVSWEVARGDDEPSGDGPTIWLGGGVGVGTYGLSALADLSVRGEGPNVFMARWAGTVGFDPDWTGTTGWWHPDANDLGVLYGRSEDGVAALAGPGVAWGNRQSADGVGTGPPIGPTLGLALQLQLPLVTADLYRLALTGFANVNSEKSFGGVTVFLEHRPF